MSLPDPRPLSEIPDEELSPMVLSNRTVTVAWGIAYSVLYLAAVGAMYLLEPAEGSALSAGLLWGILAGPLVAANELYFRQIWWPYRREMRRRGGVPPIHVRKHPYNWETQTFAVAFLIGSFALIAALVFVWTEDFQGGRGWLLFNFAAIAGPPMLLYGFAAGCFMKVKEDPDG